MKTIKDKLFDFFVSKEDVKVVKTNGESVIVRGHSLSIFADPITGRTKDSEDVEIFISDIQDVMLA